jgi:uncharacterized OB-fold protein
LEFSKSVVNNQMYAPAFWREQHRRFRLIGVKCKKCGRNYFPFQHICSCGGTEFEDVEMPRKGKIFSWSGIIVPPATGIEQVELTGPYLLVIVELENGVKVLSQITDYLPIKTMQGKEKQIGIGTPVEMVLRRVYVSQTGQVQYGFKFRPISEEPTQKKEEQ